MLLQASLPGGIQSDLIAHNLPTLMTTTVENKGPTANHLHFLRPTATPYAIHRKMALLSNDHIHII